MKKIKTLFQNWWSTLISLFYNGVSSRLIKRVLMNCILLEMVGENFRGTFEGSFLNSSFLSSDVWETGFWTVCNKNTESDWTATTHTPYPPLSTSFIHKYQPKDRTTQQRSSVLGPTPWRSAAKAYPKRAEVGSNPQKDPTRWLFCGRQWAIPAQGCPPAPLLAQTVPSCCTTVIAQQLLEMVSTATRTKVFCFLGMLLNQTKPLLFSL